MSHRFILLGVLVVMLPLWLGMALSFSDGLQQWSQIEEGLLVDVSVNTFVLVVKVSALSVLIGVFFAWNAQLYRLPFQRFIHIALLLPLAIPPYVAGFVFIGLWDYSGSVQGMLRSMGWLDGGVDVRQGSWGVAIAMSMLLASYSYVLTTAAFRQQNPSMIRAALVFSQYDRFKAFRVLLSLLRPSIMAALVLIVMEVLADFGMVSMFNYNTFTLAIYSAWEDYRSLPLALVLSLHVLVIAVLLMATEERLRGRQRFDNKAQRLLPFLKPSRGRQVLYFSAVGFWLVGCLVLPLGQLLVWAFEYAQPDARYWVWLSHSMQLTVLAVLLLIMIALPVSWLQRTCHHSAMVRWVLRLSSIGYALPGTMVAMVFLVLIAWGDWLQFGVGVVLWAYVIRFLSLAKKPIDASWAGIAPTLEQSAKIYEPSRLQRIRRVYLPLLKSGIISAGLLVMLEVIKELPIVLILSPAQWNTLAIRVYNLAAEGLYEEAAPAAVLLVVLAGGLYTAAQLRWSARRS